MSYLTYLSGMGFGPAILSIMPLLGILILWDLVWKGIALWKCGINNQLVWFLAILIFNTAGILPIIYLVFFQAKEKTQRKGRK
ncbi:MAG: DUF5652 family protein [archaeon]